MSDKRRKPRVCGMCARVTERDVERKFCPVTSRRIYHNKPAGNCGFFAEDESFRRSWRKERIDEDVYE